MEEEVRRYVVVEVNAVKLHHDFGLDIERASRIYPEVVEELRRRGLHVMRNPYGAGFIVANDEGVLRQIERAAKRSGLILEEKA